MTDVNELDPISESVLRRALRLEADEPAPLLDAMAIASAAERRTVADRLLRVVRGAALVGVSLGVAAAVGLTTFNAIADLDPSGLYGFGLATFAGLAEGLVPLASIAMDPAVAIATLAAVTFATIYERGSRRESIRVQAS